MTRISVPRGREGQPSAAAPGPIPSFDDDTLEMKRTPSGPDLDDTVSEMPLEVLLPPDVPELTPAGPGMEPTTQRHVARIPAAPELTPKTLDRRHPKYGGQLMDAVLSEVTDVIPDREQALDVLIAQRTRSRGSDSELHGTAEAELARLLGERNSGESDPSDRAPVHASGRSDDPDSRARTQRALFPVDVDGSRSTFVTSMVVGMALVIVGAATAVLALPMLPEHMLNRLVPRTALTGANPTTASAADPALGGTGPLAASSNTARTGLDRGSLILLAAEGDSKAMALLAGKQPRDLTAAELVALSSGQLQRRRAELSTLREGLATRRRQPTPELLREVMTAARDPALADDALLTLAEWPEPQGHDALWELATDPHGHDRPRALARDLLSREQAAARLSPALKVAVELSELTRLPADARSCAQLSDLVVRARDSADVRSLTLLGALTARRGCGPKKADDCYPCLRTAPALEQAIRAVKRRPAPRLP